MIAQLLTVTVANSRPTHSDGLVINYVAICCMVRVHFIQSVSNFITNLYCKTIESINVHTGGDDMMIS